MTTVSPTTKLLLSGPLHTVISRLLENSSSPVNCSLGLIPTLLATSSRETLFGLSLTSTNTGSPPTSTDVHDFESATLTFLTELTLHPRSSASSLYIWPNA